MSSTLENPVKTDLRPPGEISGPLAWLILGGAALALFFMRLSGPPDLMENDQGKPAAYILDAVVNGNWLCQHDNGGVITSKPPLYTWLAAAGMAASGQINTFWLYLPNALALTGVAALLLVAGKKIWDTRAGIFAALAFLFCHLGMKHIGLARTDAVFAFTVALTAWFAYGAWARGWNWIWFWLACAATTLAKGPLGILLAGFGLLAAVWERQAGGLKRGKKSQLTGFLLFALICGGWWWLAYARFEEELTQEMIRNELLRRAVATDATNSFWSGLLKPTGHFLSRFTPWILFTLAELWRIYRAPAVEKSQRSCERFLFCWLVGGWLLFSVVPYHRPDYILPLLPAAALLAGVALARWLRYVPVRKVIAYAVAVVVIGLTAEWFYYNASHLKLRPNTQFTEQTCGMRDLARQVRTAVGDGFPLTQVDSPAALQFYSRTMWTQVSASRAAALLRDDAAAFVVVQDFAALNSAPGEFHCVAQWPVAGTPYIRIVSNRPRLEKCSPLAFCDGPFRVTMANATLQGKNENTYNITASSRDFAVEVVNESERAHSVSVVVDGCTRPLGRKATLQPGEKLRVTAE